MLRITIETTMSSRYPLFRIRWLLIGLQVFCFIHDIVAGSRFASRNAIIIWALLAVFAFFAIIVCVADLSVHKKSSSPPPSPIYSALDFDPPAAQPSASEPASESSSKSQQKKPAAPDGDNLDVLSVNDEEERIPFITPKAESSHDRPDNAHYHSTEIPLKPWKTITFLDFFLAVALTVLYFAVMAVETRPQHVIRIFAITGTVITIVLHVYCFGKEFQALIRERRKQGHSKLRGGAVRI